MPYKRPTLAENVQETEANIASRLEGADTRLRRATLSVLARVVGGVAHGLYGYIDWVSRQLFPMSADEEYLAFHGGLRKIYRKAAAAAEGKGVFEGTPGSVLPAGTAIKRTDGAEYETLEDAVADSRGFAYARMSALEAGALGNAAAGTGLSLVSPVLGFQSSGKVDDSGLVGGLDQESVESWRGRIVYRWQNPERGSSITDWIRYALEVPGVSKAYCIPHWVGVGTIGMIIVGDLAGGTPVPDAVTVRRCQEHLDDPRRRPPGPSDIVVIPVKPKYVDVTIANLRPDTESVRQAVKAELEDLFLRETEAGREMPRSHIIEAIAAATGEYDHTLATPEHNIVARPNELPLIGQVTFTGGA